MTTARVGLDTFILVVLFVLVPLTNTFGDVFPELDAGSSGNYASFALAIVLFVRSGLVLPPKKAFVLCLLLALTYFANYLLTEYASPKWLLNTLGFLCIFYAIVGTLSRAETALLDSFMTSVTRAMWAISVLFVILFGWAFVTNTGVILGSFQSREFNENVALLTALFGLEKQSFGNLLNIYFAWVLVTWRTTSRLTKFLSVTAVVLGLPFWIGVRTTLLTSFLVLFWYLALVKSAALKWVVFACLTLSTPWIALHWDAIYGLVEEYYDRLPSLLFAIDTAKNDIFGLGNGGYHVYVGLTSDQLLTQFASEQQKFFWSAPESDLVYFIASFGVLSIVFFSLFWYLVGRSATLLRVAYLTLAERWLLISAVGLVFAGISQDNAGGLAWWISMAAGVGILLRHDGVAPISPASADCPRLRPKHGELHEEVQPCP